VRALSSIIKVTLALPEPPSQATSDRHFLLLYSPNDTPRTCAVFITVVTCAATADRSFRVLFALGLVGPAVPVIFFPCILTAAASFVAKPVRSLFYSTAIIVVVIGSDVW